MCPGTIVAYNTDVQYPTSVVGDLFTWLQELLEHVSSPLPRVCLLHYPEWKKQQTATVTGSQRPQEAAAVKEYRWDIRTYCIDTHTRAHTYIHILYIQTYIHTYAHAYIIHTYVHTYIMFLGLIFHFQK